VLGDLCTDVRRVAVSPWTEDGEELDDNFDFVVEKNKKIPGGVPE
jgi:hypothetical protein